MIKFESKIVFYLLTPRKYTVVSFELGNAGMANNLGSVE